MTPRAGIAVAVGLILAVGLAACSDEGAAEESATLLIGGIPDQELSVLEERFGLLAEYLSDELDIDVAYQPAVDYTAIVSAFRNGDVHLAWYGGLTGMQARTLVPDAVAVAQRPIDQRFRSVFIRNTDFAAESLKDLAGARFTFGSESSTSGHLMPRYFLQEAGVDPESDLDGRPSYSGSHDQTWKLVDAGSYDAGALNEAVWERLREEGEVDPERVEVVATTPEYMDYLWLAHPDIDERFGEGTVEALQEALLALHERAGDDERAAQVLERFDAERFVRVDLADYEPLIETAENLGLLGEVPE